MKKRTLDEYRQTKEYDGGLWSTSEKPSKGFIKAQEEAKQLQDECERDYLEEAKIEIVDKITRHLSDVIFEKVCNEKEGS